MKSNQYGIVLSVALLGGAVLLPQMSAAQTSARFRSLDRNRDGVISRAEWRGNDDSFRKQDRKFSPSPVTGGIHELVALH